MDWLTSLDGVRPSLSLLDPALFEKRTVVDLTWSIYRTVDANNFAHYNAVTEANGTVVVLVVAIPGANDEADRTALLDPLLAQFAVSGN